MKGKILVLLLCCVALFFVSLRLGQHRGDLAGADEEAQVLIQEVAPDFSPWFGPLWEPPSGEIETLMFALQAATGGLVIGYILGKRSVR
ncbi:energy-coupling factor ABC transporter substrate-binding protein [Candidatus Caldatribacterium sp. SIUC1]|uniref:energy-coupling factor ABC transporter substrate-binding protein n=1 Tax=Candidatus Caldatribacterium sp. SIUC1 TaxID=3418365 RepID=UPI003F68E29D